MPFAQLARSAFAGRDGLPRDPPQRSRWSLRVRRLKMVDALRHVRRRTSGTHPLLFPPSSIFRVVSRISRANSVWHVARLPDMPLRSRAPLGRALDTGVRTARSQGFSGRDGLPRDPPQRSRWSLRVRRLKWWTHSGTSGVARLERILCYFIPLPFFALFREFRGQIPSGTWRAFRTCHAGRARSRAIIWGVAPDTAIACAVAGHTGARSLPK
jgi:hypothetical protein